MAERQLSIGNKKLSYKTYGSGNPVILLHGFGEDGEVFKQQVNLLQQEFMLIVPDLPGTGSSDLIDDMTMDGMAEVIKLLIDEINSGVLAKEAEPAKSATRAGTGPDPVPAKPVLLGHSMGGYITLAVVEKYEPDLKGFGLIHSACFADTEEKKETRKKGIAFINEHGPKAFLENTSPNLFSPVTKDTKPGVVETFIKGMPAFPKEALISYYEGMMARPDRSNVLKSTPLPVLIVLGQHDTAIPIKDGMRQTSFPDLSYISVLQDSGHMGMIEEPGELNRILSNFLHDI